MADLCALVPRVTSEKTQRHRAMNLFLVSCTYRLQHSRYRFLQPAVLFPSSLHVPPTQLMLPGRQNDASQFARSG